jgi:hypothetical protein
MVRKILLFPRNLAAIEFLKGVHPFPLFFLLDGYTRE